LRQTRSTFSSQDSTISGGKQQIWDNKPPLLSHHHQVQVQVQDLYYFVMSLNRMHAKDEDEFRLLQTILFISYHLFKAQIKEH